MRTEIKQQRALEKAAELAKLLGTEIPAEAVELPLETEADKVYEAEAAINYFKLRGVGYTHSQCAWCDQEFAYSWTFTGVKYCSNTCRKRYFESIGIKWDPNRTLDDRYRAWRSRPGVVSPEALAQLNDLLDQSEDLNHDIQADHSDDTDLQ